MDKRDSDQLNKPKYYEHRETNNLNLIDIPNNLNNNLERLESMCTKRVRKRNADIYTVKELESLSYLLDGRSNQSILNASKAKIEELKQFKLKLHDETEAIKNFPIKKKSRKISRPREFLWKLNKDEPVTFWPVETLVAGHRVNIISEDGENYVHYLVWLQRPSVLLPYDEYILDPKSWRFLDEAKLKIVTFLLNERIDTDINPVFNRDVWKGIQLVEVDGKLFLRIEYAVTPVPYQCLSLALKVELLKRIADDSVNFADADAFVNLVQLDGFDNPRAVTVLDRYTDIYQLFCLNYDEKLLAMPEYTPPASYTQKERAILQKIDDFMLEVINDSVLNKLNFDLRVEPLFTTGIYLNYSESNRTDDFYGFDLISDYLSIPVGRISSQQSVKFTPSASGKADKENEFMRPVCEILTKTRAYHVFTSLSTCERKNFKRKENKKKKFVTARFSKTTSIKKSAIQDITNCNSQSSEGSDFTRSAASIQANVGNFPITVDNGSTHKCITSANTNSMENVIAEDNHDKDNRILLQIEETDPTTPSMEGTGTAILPTNEAESVMQDITNCSSQSSEGSDFTRIAASIQANVGNFPITVDNGSTADAIFSVSTQDNCTHQCIKSANENSMENVIAEDNHDKDNRILLQIEETDPTTLSMEGTETAILPANETESIARTEFAKCNHYYDKSESSECVQCRNYNDTTTVIMENEATVVVYQAKRYESKTKHAKTIQKPAILCDLCGTGFSCMKYLTTHCKRKHIQEITACKMCNKQYNKGTASYHKWLHLRGEYICSICLWGFRTSKQRNDHIRLCHKD